MSKLFIDEAKLNAEISKRQLEEYKKESADKIVEMASTMYSNTHSLDKNFDSRKEWEKACLFQAIQASETAPFASEYEKEAKKAYHSWANTPGIR